MASDEEVKHRIRISVDIHSVKNNNFQGNVFVKYIEVPAMNITAFKTTSTVPLFQKHFEEQYFANSSGFCSYEFDAAKDTLLTTIKQEKLCVELWHKDRLKTDNLIGKSIVEFGEVLKFPIKKTKQSYVRIYDSFHSVDQYNYDDNPIGKLGEIRIIIYMEDLGPTMLLMNNTDGINQEYNKEVEDMINFNAPEADGHEMAKIPAGMSVDEDNFQHKMILKEMADIESKVIWELENWKRAEEARFRYNLKQKEADQLAQLKTEWRKKDIDREKVFKAHEAKLIGFNQKMQNKLNLLNKREGRLILLEEELKQKIQETSRQLSQKDQEVDGAQQKMKEEKTKLLKKNKDLEEKLLQRDELIKNLEEDFKLYRLEQDKSPAEMIKKELNAKIFEINELRRELDKTEEIKEEYRKHFDRLKEEVFKLKRERDQAIINANKDHSKEIDLIRQQISNMNTATNANMNFNQLRNELDNIRQHGGGAFAESPETFAPQRNGKFGSSQSNQFPRISDGARYTNDQFKHSGTYEDRLELSNLNRLRLERNQLLKQGYLENDPLVNQIDQAIQELNGVQ